MPDTTPTLFSMETAPTNGHPAPPASDAEERPGYQFVKRIGWIPEDWDSTTIRRCCDILDNKRVPLNSVERSEMDGDVPYYGANGLVGYVDDFIFDEPLILLAEDGGFFDEFATREVAYQIDGKSWVNNHAHVLRAKSGCDQDFVFYTLVHKNVVPWLSGGTRAKLTKGELQKLPIQAPPLPEQREIARVLGAWDRALADLDALTEAKRQRARGLAQRLLTGRARLPGFEDSPLRSVSISEVAEVNPRRPRGIEPDDTVSFVGMADVSEDGRLDGSEERPYSEVSKGYTPFEDGDVLVAKITPCFENGKGCLASGLAGGVGYGSAEFHVLRAGPDVLPETLLAHTLSHRFRRKGEAFMTGSGGQQRVGAGFFDHFKIKLPSIDEQRQIAAVLDAVEAEVAAHKAQRAALAAQKRGLMQRLLTGETRVTVNGDGVQAPEPIS